MIPEAFCTSDTNGQCSQPCPPRCDSKVPGQSSVCGALDIQACIECAHGGSCSVNQAVAQCYVNRNVQCTTRAECESSSGVCSDVDLLINLNYTNPVWGACAVSKVTVNPKQPAYCPYPLKTFRNYCLNYAITKSECPSVGGTWFSPALNEKDCVKQEGCYQEGALTYSPDGATFFTPMNFWYNWSPKSKEECESPYNQPAFWKSWFTWKAGKWIVGNPRALTWTQKKSSSLNSYVKQWVPNTFLSDFHRVITNLKDTQAYKTDTVCQFLSREKILKSIACDCFSTHPDCFEQPGEASQGI